MCFRVFAVCSWLMSLVTRSSTWSVTTGNDHPGHSDTNIWQWLTDNDNVDAGIFIQHDARVCSKYFITMHTRLIPDPFTKVRIGTDMDAAFVIITVSRSNFDAAAGAIRLLQGTLVSWVSIRRTCSEGAEMPRPPELALSNTKSFALSPFWMLELLNLPLKLNHPGWRKHWQTNSLFIMCNLYSWHQPLSDGFKISGKCKIQRSIVRSDPHLVNILNITISPDQSEVSLRPLGSLVLISRRATNL